MRKPAKKRRSVFRIDVTPQTLERIEKISEELGITQIAISSHLMLWFAKQPPLVQLAIVGTYPDDIRDDVSELVMRAIRDEGPARPAGDDSKPSR